MLGSLMALQATGGSECSATDATMGLASWGGIWRRLGVTDRIAKENAIHQNLPGTFVRHEMRPSLRILRQSRETVREVGPKEIRILF